LLATVINIKAEDFAGDISFLKHDSKIAITFNYDGIKIGGTSARQFIMSEYGDNKHKKAFKARFNSFAEYESYWKDSVMPRLEKTFIDNFKAKQAKLKKISSLQIVDEKDCQFLIKVTLNNIDADGEIDAIATVMKKTDKGYDEPDAYINLNADGEHGNGLENKIPEPFEDLGKDLCSEINKHMPK
jgi:hypothetical protein